MVGVDQSNIMTYDAQRIAIAEACGWYLLDMEDAPSKRPVDKICVLRIEHLPDYPHDLNAMHDAEQLLLDEPDAWPHYVEYLHRIAPRPLTIRADASKRAEAFLRTKGLWKD